METSKNSIKVVFFFFNSEFLLGAAIVNTRPLTIDNPVSKMNRWCEYQEISGQTVCPVGQNYALLHRYETIFFNQLPFRISAGHLS